MIELNAYSKSLSKVSLKGKNIIIIKRSLFTLIED